MPRVTTQAILLYLVRSYIFFLHKGDNSASCELTSTSLAWVQQQALLLGIVFKMCQHPVTSECEGFGGVWLGNVRELSGCYR